MRFRLFGKDGLQPPSLSRTLTRYVFNAAFTVYLVLFIGIASSTVFTVQSILDAQNIKISTVSDQINIYLQEIDQITLLLADSVQHLDQDELAEFLDHAREDSPSFTSIYVVNPAGIVTVESSDSPMLLGLDLSGEPFFENVQPGKPYYSEPFISLLEEDVVVTTAAPINSDGEYKGLLVAELNLSSLQDVVNEASFEEGTTFIIDSKGTYIAHPNHVLVQERQYFEHPELIENAESPIDYFEIFKDEQQGQWQIASIALVNNNWYVITQQSLTKVFFPVALIILTSTLVFILTIWLFFSRTQTSLKKIAAPVSNLAEKAEQISEGNYDLQFDHTGASYQEIDSLEKSFFRMIAAIQSRDHFLEHRVEQRTRQLEEANQDLEAFMYSVSHDLRAPLRAVVGYSEILETDYGSNLDEEGKMYLERIMAQGQRMDDLITDLLDLSRLGRQSLKIEEVNLSELAQSVFLREIEKFESGSITELVLHITPPTQADPKLMEIMLTNLIDNAIKFSALKERPRLEFGYEKNGDDCYYYLKDNGVGFDPKYKDKLFLPFQRLHDPEKFEGSGIGLAIVQRVIRIHEGQIWVDSAKGEGTTFYFIL